MKANIFVSVMAGLILVAANTGMVSAESAKEKAQKEIDQAFDDASNEIESEASEANREIGEAEKEAVTEINQATAESGAEKNTDEAIKESETEIKDAVKEVSEEARKAVEELKQEAKKELEEARVEAAEELEEYKEEAEEEKYRHGGAFTMQMLYLDTDPLKDLAGKEYDLRGKRFDFDRQAMPMIGGVGYYDVGSGMRIGMNCAIGYKRWVSDNFTTVKITAGDTVLTDSCAVLRLWPAYIGFNFEKAFELGRVSLFMGGLFGGGVNVLYKQFEDRTNQSAFINVSADTADEDIDTDIGDFGISSFAAFDIHGGIMFRLAPVFSMGIEPFVLFNYAPEGFGTGFGDFFTTSPGLRMRFSFSRT